MKLKSVRRIVALLAFVVLVATLLMIQNALAHYVVLYNLCNNIGTIGDFNARLPPGFIFFVRTTRADIIVELPACVVILCAENTNLVLCIPRRMALSWLQAPFNKYVSHYFANLWCRNTGPSLLL